LRVQFAPKSGCADGGALDVELRTRGLRVAGANDAAGADVTIDVHAIPAGYEATMTLSGPAGDPSEAAVRTIIVPTCDEVWSTFALTLALAFAELPTPPAARVKEPPGSEPKGVSPSGRKTNFPARATGPRALRFAIGNTARISWGIGPAPSVTVGIFAELEADRGGRPFSPAVRLGAFVTEPSSALVPGPTGTGVQEFARFTLQSAEIEFCPFRFAAAIVLRPCARGEIGRLRGATTNYTFPNGSTLSSPEEKDEVWSTLELSLSARWEPVRPWFVQIDGAVGPALSRPEFVSKAGVRVHEVPVFAGQVGISAGAHFP